MPLPSSQSPSQVGLPIGPGSRPPVPTVARPLVAVRTSWGVCCSDASSWILISGHAGSPDLPASGWGDREGPGEGGRREPPHWPRGGTRETGGMDGRSAPVLPNPTEPLPLGLPPLTPFFTAPPPSCITLQGLSGNHQPSKPPTTLGWTMTSPLSPCQGQFHHTPPPGA